MKKLLSALFICLLSTAAYPQAKTKTVITTEVSTNLADNTTGAITPAIVRSILDDIINSYWDMNGANSFACTTGQFLASGTVSSQTCSPAVTSIGGMTGIIATGNGLTASNNTLAVSLTATQNALANVVSLNNESLYFDGPQIGQGTSGTWFVSSTVTLTDSAAAPNFICKLWDGTTVVDAAISRLTASTGYVTITLSGFIVSPAANLKVSCNDPNSTTGSMQFNATSTGKDTLISAHRIQ